MSCKIQIRKADVTDRMNRYRARKCIDREHLKRCPFCGASKNIRIHHLNADEADYAPENLIAACVSCNATIGYLLKRHNIGRRVDLEYSKKNPEGARSLAQWMMAVKSMKGESQDMTPRQAIAMIHATPPKRRSQFADDIWKIRRAKGTDRTAVPF